MRDGTFNKKKVNARMQLLQKVWSFGSRLEEMVHLWKVYCLSILEQSCVVWGGSLTAENKGHTMETRGKDQFKVNHANTARYFNSAIPSMQRLLNEN